MKPTRHAIADIRPKRVADLVSSIVTFQAFVEMLKKNYDDSVTPSANAALSEHLKANGLDSFDDLFTRVMEVFSNEDEVHLLKFARLYDSHAEELCSIEQTRRHQDPTYRGPLKKCIDNLCAIRWFQQVCQDTFIAFEHNKDTIKSISDSWDTDKDAAMPLIHKVCAAIQRSVHEEGSLDRHWMFLRHLDRENESFTGYDPTFEEILKMCDEGEIKCFRPAL